MKREEKKEENDPSYAHVAHRSTQMLTFFVCRQFLHWMSSLVAFARVAAAEMMMPGATINLDMLLDCADMSP